MTMLKILHQRGFSDQREEKGRTALSQTSQQRLLRMKLRKRLRWTETRPQWRDSLEVKTRPAARRERRDRTWPRSPRRRT